MSHSNVVFLVNTEGLQALFSCHYSTVCYIYHDRFLSFREVGHQNTPFRLVLVFLPFSHILQHVQPDRSHLPALLLDWFALQIFFSFACPTDLQFKMSFPSPRMHQCTCSSTRFQLVSEPAAPFCTRFWIVLHSSKIMFRFMFFFLKFIGFNIVDTWTR